VPNPISITSANAKLTLTASSDAGIIVGPFTVQGYAQDAAFAVEPVDSAEVLMGVDGKLAAGYLPRITKFTVSLMANSPSRPLFETVDNAQKVLGDILTLNGALAAPSLGVAYALVKGVLSRLTPIPTARRSFSEPVVYELSFESVTPAPISV
jgi:hypothetical protein